MSVLAAPEIRKAIKAGRIKVTPFDPAAIGPGSIDLTLGDTFRVFKSSRKVYDVDDRADYTKITRLVRAKSVVVKPGETILGITRERITLAPDLCGWLEGRSRYARLGLMVHISASFMQPGISNRQVLEISNMGHVPLRLHAGTKICQFVFQRAVGKAEYTGEFSGQVAP